MDLPNSRRRFLRSTSVVAVGVPLAGCLGDGDDDTQADDGDDTDDTDDTDGTSDADTADDDHGDDEDDDGIDDEDDTDDADDTDEADEDDTPFGADIDPVAPVAEEDVLLWYPFAEGAGDTLGAEIDAYGDSDGVIEGSEWVEGEWMGGTTLQSGGQFDDAVLTGTWGDFGSTVTNGGHTACITVDIDSTGGVMIGNRNPFSTNTWNMECDSRADGRFGQYIRTDYEGGSEPNYIASSTEITGEGKFRAATRIDTSADANNWEIYINGEEDDTVVIDNDIGADHNDSSFDMMADFEEPFAINAYHNQGGVDRPIQGHLDDFIVYDRRLTPEEIQEDFERQPWS